MAVLGEDGGWESSLPVVVGRGEEKGDPRTGPTGTLLCWEVASASCHIPAIPAGNGRITSELAQSSSSSRRAC